MNFNSIFYSFIQNPEMYNSLENHFNLSEVRTEYNCKTSMEKYIFSFQCFISTGF